LWYKLQDLRLGHLGKVVEHETQGLEARPKLAIVASGQGGQISLAFGRAVELLLDDALPSVLVLDTAEVKAFEDDACQSQAIHSTLAA